MDIVEQVRQRRAAEDAAHAAKLEAARRAVQEDADLRKAAEDEVAAKAAAQQAAAEQARQQAEEQRERTLALIAWQRAGGTEAEFAEAWPEMRKRQLAERVASQATRQAVATENFYRQVF